MTGRRSRRERGAPETSRLPPDASDAELVERALRDPEHFSALYHRYANRVYRYALERTHSTDIADDVVGETMLAALEGLDRFDPERGSFAGWIFTIAARRIADQQRHHRRFWRAIIRRWKPDEPQADATTEAVLHRAEYREVQSGLVRLADADREILLLRYSACLTSAEIGDRLNITPANARVRLQRARQRLARELGGDDFDA